MSRTYKTLIRRTALLLFCLITAMTHSLNAQGNQTYTNPVWPHDFPDPYVLTYRGRFYAYATQTAGSGFQVMESPDLVHWTYHGTAFTPPWASAHYWAPEVDRCEGRFYMVYSALNPRTKKHDIGIAVSKDPLGPFKQLAILVKGDKNRVGVIDADLFFDRDGTPYLSYSEEDPRAIFTRPLTRDLTAVAGPPVELIHPDRPYERGVTEAPTLIRRNGLYFLFYSGGVYQSDTKADACYFTSYAVAKKITGPYVKADAPLIQTVPDHVYSPGHQCIVTLPSGQMWMLYHAFDDQNEPHYGSNPLGRTLRLDQVFWKDNRPFMIGPTYTPQPMPKLHR